MLLYKLCASENKIQNVAVICWVHLNKQKAHTRAKTLSSWQTQINQHASFVALFFILSSRQIGLCFWLCRRNMNNICLRKLCASCNFSCIIYNTFSGHFQYISAVFVLLFKYGFCTGIYRVCVCVMQTIINIGHDYHDNVSVCCGTYCGRMECVSRLNLYETYDRTHLQHGTVSFKRYCCPQYLHTTMALMMLCHLNALSRTEELCSRMCTVGNNVLLWGKMRRPRLY